MRANAFSIRLLVVIAALSLVAAACDRGGGGGGDATDEPTQDATGGGGGGDGATLTFGTTADPVVLDGILVSDGESLRAIDQMFEGLVTLAPGGTEIKPGLAKSWEASGDGKTWTFELQEDVTFHDGEPFNAEAVCFNFERWYNFKGSFQNPDATYYWQTVFGGFANGGPKDEEGNETPSLYGGCTATGDHTVELKITKPSSSFLAALALTNFTFASPKALQEFKADEGKVDDEGVFRPTGTYGTEHPTGTGPFMFKEWTVGERLVMERNPDYWGEFPGNIQTLIFRPIANNADRLAALQAGDIQGYDLVEPQDFETITGDEGLQLIERPAFNVGYIGFAQTKQTLDADGNVTGTEPNTPVDDIEVRKAIAHAVDRQEVVDAFYAGQGEVAKEFMPPELWGYADDVVEYDYNVEKAKKILTDAGYELPVPLTFGFPTDVSRPYMPDPQANFEAFKADLEECCFTVETKSAPWSPDYLSAAQTGQYPAYLLGWTGDFGDPDNFIGTFFQSPDSQWGFENKEIHDLLDQAEAATDQAERESLYQEANRKIMEFLPGVPYVHTKPALAFAANVTGYQASPVSLEPFSLVTVEE